MDPVGVGSTLSRSARMHMLHACIYACGCTVSEALGFRVLSGITGTVVVGWHALGACGTL